MARKQKTVNPAAIRSRLGLNQSEFWNRIHVTQSGGSRFENGRPLSRAVRAMLGYVYLGEDIKRHPK